MKTKTEDALTEVSVPVDMETLISKVMPLAHMIEKAISAFGALAEWGVPDMNDAGLEKFIADVARGLRNGKVQSQG